MNIHSCPVILVMTLGICSYRGYTLTLASNVLPQPGGPASNMPDGAVSPSALNCSGFRTGAYNRTVAREGK